LNTGLSLFSDTAEVIDVFSAMYRHFIVLTPPAHGIHCYVLLQPPAGDQPLAIIDGTAHALFAGELFISHAHMLIFQHILERIDSHMLIHAGVVAKDGRGIVIAGHSAYGKTTLILELVRRGYQFFSDEFCPVSLHDFSIMSFPRCLGLRESSPFLNDANRDSFLLLKNIGRGKKHIVDCNALFPDCIGSRCTALCLVFLRGALGAQPAEHRNFYDIALYNNNQKIVDEIIQCDTGIMHVDTYAEKNYTVFRFSVPAGGHFTKKLNDLYARYKTEIFYRERIADAIPDFSSPPHIVPVAKSQASLEVLKNIRNLSEQSLLSKKLPSRSALLLKIADFLSAVDCYDMQVGQLRKSADVLEGLL
jgi:hypothetical protein